VGESSNILGGPPKVENTQCQINPRRRRENVSPGKKKKEPAVREGNGLSPKFLGELEGGGQAQRQKKTTVQRRDQRREGGDEWGKKKREKKKGERKH